MCNTKQELKQVETAKGLAKLFSVDVCIKIFGVTIWEYHYPPKNL